MPTPTQSLELLNDDTFEQELARREVGKKYAQGLKKSIDPDGFKSQFQKAMIFKDLGFTRDDVVSGNAEASMAQHFKLESNYQWEHLRDKIGEHIQGESKKQTDYHNVYKQLLDEEFNDQPVKLYADPVMNGHRQKAKASISNLKSYQRNFLQNIMKVTESDGFMFGKEGENTDLEGRDRLGILMESWALMSPQEKEHTRKLLPFVAGPAWERTPEREARLGQMVGEAVQGGREGALSAFAHWGSSIADITIRKAMGTRRSDEEKYRYSEEERLKVMLTELRQRRRDKIEEAPEFLGFDTTSFKKMLAGTAGEMATLMSQGPAAILTYLQGYREADIMQRQDKPGRLFANMAQAATYYAAGRMQLKYLTPSKLGGATITGTFGKNVLKRVSGELVQEGIQDAVPMMIDELNAAVDEDIADPDWGEWVQGWKENGPEALVMFFALGAAASGGEISMNKYKGSKLADQTADPDLLQWAGLAQNRAEEISQMEDPVARMEAIQEAHEAGEVDKTRQLPEDVRERVIAKAREGQAEQDQTRPTIDQLPDGTMRVGLPTGEVEVVADEEAAIAAIDNWREQLIETTRSRLGEEEFNTQLGQLTQAEAKRFQEATGQRIELMPEETRSFKALFDSGIIDRDTATNRITDLAHQQVAEGLTDLDPDTHAAVMVESFFAGEQDFDVLGQADPNSRVENGVINAAMQLNPKATVSTIWEEGLENHMHAMFNGNHYELDQVIGWLEELEGQTGEKFLAGKTREQVIEAFSFAGRSYMTGEMAASGTIKKVFDSLMQMLMEIIGIATQIQAVRDSGQLNPELEAQFRAGLGLDGGKLYNSLVTKAQNSQGMSSPPTNSISVPKAAALANAAGVKETKKAEFYGKIWPKFLRDTGQFDDMTPEGMMKAAHAMIDDLLEFIADNPQFLGYYNEDWAATKSVLDEHYGGINDNEFAMYRFLVGIMSPSTPLNKNILESLSAFDWMQSGRDYNMAVRLYIGPKGNPKGDPVGGGFNVLNPQGATWVTKARNVKTALDIMKKLDLDWAGFQQWIGQTSTHAEIKALRNEMGYKGVLPAKTMATLMVPGGYVEGVSTSSTAEEVEKAVIKHSRNKENRYPNGFFFGKKVGPYTLNSMGYPQYSTVDIWESRAIRSYLGLFDADKKMLDLPKASEDLIFARFIIAFREAFKERFPDIRADVTDLQALRWFFMIGESNTAGFKRSDVETISQYTDKHTTTMGSVGFRALAKGVSDGSALPALVLPKPQKGTFSIANKRDMFEKVKSMPDGFTINPRTGELVDTGWVVAPRKHTETELPNMTYEDFSGFIDSYGREFRNDEEAHFGGWLRADDNTFVMDVVTTYDDGADAANVADANDQDAIFDLSTFTQVDRKDYSSTFPGFEGRSPKAKGVVAPRPNYVAPMVEHVNFPGTDYEARFTRETVDGIADNELVHFVGRHTGAIDHIKVQVAGSKGAEKKTYREYPELYTKRAYVAFNGYKVETQYGIESDKGYKVEVHPSHWYPQDDPLGLVELARQKAKQLGYEGDKTAINEIYMAEVRDAGFLGFKASTGTVGVILSDLDVEKGLPDVNPAATFSIASQDKLYSDLVENGKLDEARALVNKAAADSGVAIFDDVEAFDMRKGPEPKNTVKAYKLFRMKPDGNLYPLFVGANDPVPMGHWLDAKAGPETTKKSGGKAVKSKLGPLAYRPGWHAGDLPLATHIGKKWRGKVKWRKADEVWAEVEMAADVDYQPEASANKSRDIKRMPTDGHYRFKTNPNMTGEWLISGSMKVTKIMGEEEVNGLIGDAKMPWAKIKPTDNTVRGITGKLDTEAFGLEVGEWYDPGKINDITYDNDGNLIPLSKRFRDDDPRATFSISGKPMVKDSFPGFNRLPSKSGDRYTAQYAEGKGFVDFVVPSGTKDIVINTVIAQDGKMVRGILNDLKQAAPGYDIQLGGMVPPFARKFWSEIENEGRIARATYSITGKKGGKKVPKGKALLGIVDDNMRVKTKLGPERGWYHDEAFGSYASSRAMSRFRVLDDKTILFMEDPGPAREAINFELEYLGYEIKTVSGAGRSNWTWSISPSQLPTWPGTGDGGKLAKWFDDVAAWEAKADEGQPLLFETAENTIGAVVRNVGRGKPWVIRYKDMRDATETGVKDFDTRVHALAFLGKTGAKMVDYFDLQTFSLNPEMQSLFERIEQRAMSADAKGSPGATDAYLKMLVNVERLIQRNQQRRNFPESKVGRDRLSLTQDLAAYDAMLSSLPPEVRARMGGWATLGGKAKHETRIKFLTERLPMIEKHLDNFLRKEYLGRIDDLIKRSKVKVDNGVAKGKDAKMHEVLDSIEAVMDLAPSEIAARETAIEASIAAAQDSDAATALTEELIMLQTFGNLKLKGEQAPPAEDVHEAMVEIQTVIANGMTRYRAKQEARRAEQEALREGIINDITEGEGILEPSEAKRRAPGKFKALAQQYFYGLTSWEWMLNWAMGRGENALRNSNVARLGRMAHVASHRENRMNIQATEEMIRHLASIWGIEGRMIVVRRKVSEKLEALQAEQDTPIRKMQITPADGGDIQIPVEKAQQLVEGSVRPEALGLHPWDLEPIQTALEANEARRRPRGAISLERQAVGPVTEMRLSQDQAIYLTMMGSQTEARKAMARWGYTDDVFDQMESWLSPEAKAIRDFLRVKYDANWNTLNEVYKDRFGVNMSRIKNYSPTSYIHQGQDQKEMLLEEVTPGATTTPGFAKQRIRHRAQPREDVGAIEAYLAHFRQSNHFVSWSGPVGDMRQQLQHRDVQLALKQHRGDHLVRYINERIDYFADGGNRSVKSLWVLDWMRKKFTVLALAWNWGVMMKQLSSQPAFLFDNDVPTFMKYSAKFWTNPAKHFKEMWETEFVQERFTTGFDRDVMLAMGGKGKRDIFNWILETGMITGRTGDIIPVMVGGWAVRQATYDAARKAGKGEAQAEAEANVAFEMSVERAQQAGDVKDLSSFQQGGSVNRIFTMFLTSPLQYYMNTYHALANLKAEGGKKDFAKRVLVSHIMLPFAFQFISDLVGSLKDDEDEPLLNPVDYVRAFLLGPMNGLFVVGHGATYATGMAVNAVVDIINGEDGEMEKSTVYGYRNPVVQLIGETGQGLGDASEGMQEIFTEDRSVDDVVEVADGIAEAGKMYGPLGIYDVSSRVLKSIGLEGAVTNAIRPADEKLADHIRDLKAKAYALREDDYKAASEALKKDKDDEDAKELRKEIQDARWEELSYLLVQALKNEDHETITEALEELPENHIPARVKKNAFGELDYTEPEE